MDIDTLLSTTDYFRDLSAAHRHAVATLCRRREIGKRETLFREGQAGRSVFVLAEGRLQLLKTAPDGREIVIKTVAPGEFFAEVILFEQERYPVSAVAVERSAVFELLRADFRRLLEDESFRNEFISVLMRRLRYMADRILHLATDDVRGRLLQFLQSQYGRRETYTLTVSKKDVAAAIAVAPETLSRLILRMRRDGEMDWTGKHIRLSPACWGPDGGP
jgi:CRP/FNR family cyclic AMP-dependent transcriptional regulator